MKWHEHNSNRWQRGCKGYLNQTFSTPPTNYLMPPILHLSTLSTPICFHPIKATDTGGWGIGGRGIVEAAQHMFATATPHKFPFLHYKDSYIKQLLPHPLSAIMVRRP